MSLRLVAKILLPTLVACAGGLMLSSQQAQRIPGQAYTVRVTPCGVFGRPPCGTVVTIPAHATGETLMAMMTKSVNAGRTWEGLIYTSEAANLGYVKAEAALGAVYAAGVIVPLDLVKARYWLQKAADQGDPASQAELGEFYQTAQGGPQDMAKAIHYYQLSAAQHIPRGERDLGLAYELANGVAHDRTMAIALFRRAAADDRRIGASPAKMEAYANALSRAGSRRFTSWDDLQAFAYPAPRQTQTQTQPSNVPNGCPDELNFTGPMNMGPISRFCTAHPRCPYQRAGIENVCPSLSPGFGVN